MKRTKFQYMCYRILYSDMRTINRLVLSFSGYMKNYRDNIDNIKRIKTSRKKYVIKNRANPELKYEEKYMICYCQEHHAQFHAARGDSYANLIRARGRTDSMGLEIFLEDIAKED